MSQSKIDQLIDYLKKNGKDKSWKELTQMFNPGAPNDWSRSSCRIRGYKVEPTSGHHSVLEEKCEAAGIPIEDVSSYWLKDEQISINVKNSKSEVTMLDLLNAKIEEMKTYSPQYKNLYYPPITDGHLLVIDPADVHFGKLCRAYETGDEYNLQIARERVLGGVAGIVQKAQGFPIDKILFIGGNDKLHTDGKSRATTAGTPQDTDGNWYDAWDWAFKTEIDVIETLLPIAPIEYQLDMSNHDYANGFFLGKAIAAWFRNSSNILFNITPSDRKYFRYHNNLIGTTHGGEARVSDLHGLMAEESGMPWVECKHKYFYTHHVHHKDAKDRMSVCIESLRSPSGTDGWHHRKGFQHSPKAIEGFIHHKQHGQIARLTHIF